jgi:hypothetical protein
MARRPTACSIEHRARARFDEEHLLAVGELESATAADGHQTRHRLGQTATRSRNGIVAWHWPRRSTACWARRSSGGPVPAAPMADTAIWSTLSWPLANVVSARALIYDLVGIVPAFGPCFACSCDQKVRARLFVSSHRYRFLYKVLIGLAPSPSFHHLRPTEATSLLLPRRRPGWPRYINHRCGEFLPIPIPI